MRGHLSQHSVSDDLNFRGEDRLAVSPLTNAVSRRSGRYNAVKLNSISVYGEQNRSSVTGYYYKRS